MIGFYTIVPEEVLERLFGPPGWTTTVMAETPEPTELPDKDIVPDETPPLEDKPVKTDPVPEE